MIAASNATFSVRAIGSAPLSYQRYFWGTNLSLLPWRWRPGETPTNATLTVTNVGTSQLGPYFVIVSDAWGATTSQVATLDWPYPPKIVQLTVQPTTPVVSGENVTFSVEVTNKAMLPISYQLRKSSTIITNVVLNTRACTLTLFQVTTNSTTTNGPGSYWVVATNVANYVSGEPSSSVTLTVTNATPPSVTTLAASDVTATSALLKGVVNPNRATTTAWFEYGLTTSYGSRTLTANVGSGAEAVEVGLPVAGLLAGTNYHYRVVATNWGNYGSLTPGGDMVFATEGPVLPPAPTIAHCALRGDGCFHLEFSGQAGASYTVVGSTNLIDWVAEGAATETAPGQFEFTDAEAPQHASRFHRLRSP